MSFLVCVMQVDSNKERIKTKGKLRKVK
jgi:hypothetical protein